MKDETLIGEEQNCCTRRKIEREREREKKKGNEDENEREWKRRNGS